MTARETPGADTFIDEILDILTRNSFRDPFFDDVRAGRMSRAGVRFWAVQASLVVKQFPRFISAIHANCPSRDAQCLLAENIWEEHGGGTPDADHYALIRRLAISLGATEADLDGTEPLAETSEYIDYCLRITKDGTCAEGIAAIGLGIEYFIPVFFAGLAEALRSHYRLSSHQVEYLTVHVSDDSKHSGRSIQILRAQASSAELRDKAIRAVQQMLLVKRRFAEAVYAAVSRQTV